MKSSADGCLSVKNGFASEKNGRNIALTAVTATLTGAASNRFSAGEKSVGENMLIKRNCSYAWLFFSILFVGVWSIAAQIKESSVLYAAPSRLMLPGDENEDKELDSATLIREHFYPIGWSEDGKFAFFAEPADEACGCYYAYLGIQDLRDDKVLWEHKYTGKEEKEETISTYWKQNQAEFSRKLNEYGIVAQNQFDLQKSVFSYQKDRLTPNLKDTTKLSDELKNSGSVVLQLISKQKGRKTVYQQKFDPKEYGGFLGAELGGSLLSPFEARAAIIMVEEYRGWEGPPHTTQIRIVGATLTTGFQ